MTIDDLKSRFSNGPLDPQFFYDLDAFTRDKSQSMADRIEALYMASPCDRAERHYSEADVLVHCGD